jgi:alkylation response protein AidB-like acyl-CoA dehydrogenase
VPDDSCFSIGLGMVGPTILAYGSEAARDDYLSAIFRADVIACQLFSEPEAGSDLANVASRAVRDGDGWVLDGHKVWTSNAHLSDVGEIICRTNPDVPKHRGLTAFLVDMRSPGVTVRPLRQLTGGSAFSEVFLEGVRVPDERRLGDVDDGWRVALATLTNERAAIGVGLAGGNAYVELERVAETIRRAGRAGDSVVRDRFGDLCVRLRVADHLGRQAMSAVRAGQQPGPELSLAKLATSSNLVATAELMADVLGPQVAADTGSWGTYAWSEFLLAVPGVRIGGGTDEIQRNIIAERVLGLPKG